MAEKTSTNGGLQTKLIALEEENQRLQQRIAQLEQARTESDDLLASVIKHNPNAIAVFDKNVNYTLVSDRYIQDYGLAGQDIIGQNHYDVFPEIPQRWREIHQRSLAGAVEKSDEDSFVRADGSITYNRWECRPWYNAQNEIGGMIAFTEVITERKKAENELRIFKALADNAPDAIGIADPQGAVTYTNEAFRQMFGYDDIPLGIANSTFFAPHDQQEMLPHVMQKVVETGTWKGTLYGQRQDGRAFPAQVTAFMLTDEKNQPHVLPAIFRDMTEQQQTEDALRLTQFAMDVAPDAIFWIRPDGSFSYTNNAACTNLGYTRDALLDKRLDTVDPTQTVEVWPNTWDYVKQQGNVILESQHRHKDGTLFPVEVRASFQEYDGQEFICAFARDITARKQAEDELRTFKTLVDNSPDGIGVADMNGIFTYANPAYGHMTGYGSALIGMSTNDIVPPDTLDTGTIIQSLLEHSDIWRGEVVYQRQDGSQFPAHVSVFMARDASGQILGIPAIVRDVTEQKQAEEFQQRLVTLVEGSTDFIGFASLEGQAIYLNTAGRKLIGLEDEADFRQSQMLHYIAPEDQELAKHTVLPHLMQHGSWQGEIRFCHFKTGAYIPVNWNIFLLYDPQTGEPSIIGTVSRDLREIKRQEAERTALQQQVIEAQRDALRELSTPLIPISDQVVIMPLIGTLDSGRAQMVMETLLEGVSRYRAELAILDITGVSVVDTQVAQALVQAARAVRLLGAQVMLTGIQPQIAQTLVHLGVDLSGIITRGSLQSGIAAALTEQHIIQNGGKERRTG